MTETDDPALIGARQAWLRMLTLCLTELGVSAPATAAILQLAEGASPVRTMVVTRVDIVGESVYLAGDEGLLRVVIPAREADLGLIDEWLGQTVRYVPESETTGRLLGGAS